MVKSVQALFEQNTELRKKAEEYNKQEVKRIKNNLKDQVQNLNGINFLAYPVAADNVGIIKDVAYQLKNEMDNLVLVLGAEIHGKAHLAVMISDNLVQERQLHAGNMIKELAREIKGGGGGQPFFATAGGTDPRGIQNALDKAVDFIR